jgi:hypothetical protein
MVGENGKEIYYLYCGRRQYVTLEHDTQSLFVSGLEIHFPLNWSYLIECLQKFFGPIFESNAAKSKFHVTNMFKRSSTSVKITLQIIAFNHVSHP